ncbi:hypothetical protein FEM48_Zijuj08G0092600 [Ziziphus jujuba var. spinosa]|uniref:GATA transcription factor n=1 Tax=Ziziphus jujuba var. spinosa TaxID=714518 RepID=A0A978UY93_ZIZJJ|nr:hypothetical protein FEM48_Zijuj08G0092600 [Ziziphus jujuba var. spinosa]
MELVETALKTSISKEMLMKPSPQAFLDDLWVASGQNGVACDDFFVDDLLDLSNEDGLVDQEPEEEEEKVSVSVSTIKEHQEEQENLNPSTSFSPKDDFGSLPTSGLSVPADDLADLEWLSHFVEDSFSEFSVPYPTGILTEKHNNQTEKGPEPQIPISVDSCFKIPVPAKARSKRTRTGGRIWSLGSPSFTESSSSSTSSCSSSSPSSPLLIYTTQSIEPVGSVEKPPAKKPKKKPSVDSSGGVSVQPPRRCSHCGVQKTPQWRTGPLGAKTLCNACGVRYKSGRLLPEYRPACSPTFSSEIHSNHHRKVLEMRRKKETTESGLAPPDVPNF